MDNDVSGKNEGVDKKNQITKNEYFTFTDFQKSPKDVISDARLNGRGKSIIGVMIGCNDRRSDRYSDWKIHNE